MYDTTFGYNDLVGFRNGMCYPFRPYNLNTASEVNILEIPLALMDGTLFDVIRSYDGGMGDGKEVDLHDIINSVLTMIGIRITLIARLEIHALECMKKF
jgi:hypothetical protein